MNVPIPELVPTVPEILAGPEIVGDESTGVTAEESAVVESVLVVKLVNTLYWYAMPFESPVIMQLVVEVVQLFSDPPPTGTAVAV